MSLSLQKISRSFGGLRAVRDVDMAVLPSRVTGLVGPNGAGKTTLVNLISGLLYPDSGVMLFEARDIGRLQPHEIARGGIARTFQTVRLRGRASVRDNILAGFDQGARSNALERLFGLPGYRKELRAIDERIDAMLTEFGMTGMGDLPAAEISYGHQRRVEIMRALVGEPRLVLLDEPAAGLNDTEATALARSIRAIADAGRAVLLIEHNMHMVMSLCDDIYVLDSGSIIAHGPPGAVRNDSRVITAYLGEQGLEQPTCSK
jgi:branched-chain amino acid transport system ATP-binding protein